MATICGHYVRRVTDHIIEVKIVAPLWTEVERDFDGIKVKRRAPYGRYTHYHYFDLKRNMRSVDTCEGLENNPIARKMTKNETFNAERYEIWYGPEPRDNQEEEFDPYTYPVRPPSDWEGRSLEPEKVVKESTPKKKRGRPKKAEVKPEVEKPQKPKRKKRLVITEVHDDPEKDDKVENTEGGILDFF